MSRTTLNKMQYIGTLRSCLKARDDFKDLNYYKNSKGEEYLVMADIIGQVLILDITGYKEDAILHNIAEIICGYIPHNIVLDAEKKYEIAKLFQRTEL